MRLVGPLLLVFATGLISAVICLFFKFILPATAPVGSFYYYAHSAVALFLAFNVFFNYYHCAFTRPGKPKDFLPENVTLGDDGEETASEGEDETSGSSHNRGSISRVNVGSTSGGGGGGDGGDGGWRVKLRPQDIPHVQCGFCKKCKEPKPARAHHCHVCDMCIVNVSRNSSPFVLCHVLSLVYGLLGRGVMETFFPGVSYQVADTHTCNLRKWTCLFFSLESNGCYSGEGWVVVRLFVICVTNVISSCCRDECSGTGQCLYAKRLQSLSSPVRT
ncbi:unnamed protein product [Choristocarpus tenellus]